MPTFMNAKQRYRQQQKLESALARVVEALAKLSGHGIAPNARNLMLMACVADALGTQVVKFDQAPADGDFDPMVVPLVAPAIRRRRRQTQQKRRRSAELELQRRTSGKAGTAR